MGFEVMGLDIQDFPPMFLKKYFTVHSDPNTSRREEGTGVTI